MKKILLVTRNLPPLVGGMEKLNLYILQALHEKFDVSLAGPLGSHGYHKVESFTEFSHKPLWKYLVTSLFKTALLAKKTKPQLIMCGSGTAILAGFVASRLCSAKLVCYLHGLDIIAPSVIYQKIFVPLIRHSHHIVVNSQHTFSLAVAAGVDAKKIVILNPGVALPALSDKETLAKRFREKYALANRPFLLIAGRITPRKGIAEFLEHCFFKLREQLPDLALVIVGAEAGDAVKASTGVMQSIQQVIAQYDLTEQVIFAGRVDDELLSAAFFSASLFVFPVLNKSDDVEGFGMVSIEAAAHGLPTVGFAVGGIPDAIADGESGRLIASGDYDEMSRVISSYLQDPEKDAISATSCIAFASQFEWQHFNKKLQAIIEQY